MSNRRRQRDRGVAFEGSGVKIEARHRHHAQLPEATPGEHMWTVVGMWLVKDPTAERFDLDTENLMTLEGPGCFVCERPYAQAAGTACPGESIWQEPTWR